MKSRPILSRVLPCCLTCAVLLLSGSIASGQYTTLYSTGFNAPTYTDGALNSNTDTTTPGQDGWLNSSGAGTNNVAVISTATNGAVSLASSGQDVRRRFDSSATVTSGSVFLQATINLSTAQVAGDYFLHLGDGGTSNFYARTFAKSSAAGYQLALNTSSGGTPNYGSTVLAFNTPYTVLIRYDIVAGAANDTGALFVNPTSADGTGDTAYVAATTTGADATSIAGVYLRQGSATAGPSLTLDNISVFTSTPVPEPATVLLIGAAGLGVVGFARRRLRR